MQLRRHIALRHFHRLSPSNVLHFHIIQLTVDTNEGVAVADLDCDSKWGKANTSLTLTEVHRFKIPATSPWIELRRRF